ncbi:MAG: hypothetical protein FJX35_18890 [Alphaproteobacteria bacterium]|nr:hypothetical protein [Alphaproteobacteria bacterium]
MTGIDFAIFLALKEASSGEATQMLEVCAKSLHRSDPDATVFLLTDEATLPVLPAVPMTPIVMSQRVNVDEILLERTRAYRAFLDLAAFRRDTIFLDHDMVANRSLATTFEGRFDLAATFRTWTQKYPINGGFIAVRHASSPVVRRFYDRVLSIYEDMSAAKDRLWDGEQASLKAALSPLPDPLTAGVYTTMHGESVALFDTSRINYSIWDGYPPHALPDTMTEEMFADMARRDLVHFKGKRKSYMAGYWASLTRATRPMA